MKNKLLAVLTITLLVTSLFAGSTLARGSVGKQLMPPNPDKILTALIERGVISATASPAQKEAALQAYLQLKLNGGDADSEMNPLARKAIASAEVVLHNTPGDVQGKKLGQDGYLVEPSTPEFKPLEGEDDLLLILVDFADVDYTWTTATEEERTEAGPLYNQIPLPDNDFDLWVADFSTQYFEDMLFTPGGYVFPADHPYYPGEHRGSMRDYFIEQSYGKYTVDGTAYGWFTVDKPEAYYGDDSPDGGSDSLRPGTPKDLLADAVEVINTQGAIDWLAYDVKDLYDLDGDGIIDEPDCIIDHPLFVHAGVDQSGGGGAQGDDALWAHSSSAWIVVDEAKNEGATCSDDFEGTILYNYTIMPEDGGVGVFAHEYAHDLGLPDEYDTIYSGAGASQGFWTLQASGSWIGRPAQTQPSGMSIWAKYVLGWVAPGENMAVLDLADLDREPVYLRLEQTERWGGVDAEGVETLNAIKINLPDKYAYVNDPYSGEYEWFGGKADEIDTTLKRTVDLTGKASAELSFWTWYDIEELWDYGFVQVSTDGGATWVSLPIDGTTMDIVADGYPLIIPNLPGFTGNSGGWVHKTFDLVDYLGQSIDLQFRYMTDWGTSMAGFYLDDISVTADGEVVFFDDVETLDPAWYADGWTIDAGASYKPNYYIMEWRNLQPMETPYGDITLVNTDAGLNTAYAYDPYGLTPNQPTYYSYAPGLLLFYRDMTYTDNWTGAHPGGGYLLVVDSHDRPLISPPYPGNYGGQALPTARQSYDAAFGLDRVPDVTWTRYGITWTYEGTSAVPNFKDNHIYWNQRAPSASVINPTNGLLFRILGQAEDKSAVLMAFGNRNTLEETYLSIASDLFLFYNKYFMPFVALFR